MEENKVSDQTQNRTHDPEVSWRRLGIEKIFVLQFCVTKISKQQCNIKMHTNSRVMVKNIGE